MPDARQKSFAESLLKNTARGLPDDDTEKAAIKERQHAAQAFGLRVKFKDGRHTQGFAWSHYAGYEWADEGDQEKLTLLFGARALTIEGFNLSVLIRSIDEGQLKGIKELNHAQAEVMRIENSENEPIIIRVVSDPPFQEIVKEIKGEEEDEVGHARKLRGR
jgi:hypothetical protein